MDSNDQDNEFGFAVPAFDADKALLQLRRSLRDLKLGERGNSFELKGKAVLQLTKTEGAVAVRLAKRLSTTPEWDSQILRSATDQRKLLDDVKKRLERWLRDD